MGVWRCSGWVWLGLWCLVVNKVDPLRAVECLCRSSAARAERRVEQLLEVSVRATVTLRLAARLIEVGANSGQACDFVADPSDIQEKGASATPTPAYSEAHFASFSEETYASIGRLARPGVCGAQCVGAGAPAVLHI